MNQNTTRLALAGIAAFYVVIGGLWAINYFPLKEFHNQLEVERSIVDRLGYPAAFGSAEYEAAVSAQTSYAISHPDVLVTERRLGFYESLLIWGSVAIITGSTVLVLTRRRGSQADE